MITLQLSRRYFRSPSPTSDPLPLAFADPHVSKATHENAKTIRAAQKKGQQDARTQPNKADASDKPHENDMEVDPKPANPSSDHLETEHPPANDDDQIIEPEDPGSTDRNNDDKSMEDLNDLEKPTQFQPCKRIHLNSLFNHSSFHPASSPDLTHLLDRDLSSQQMMDVDSDGGGGNMSANTRMFISTAFVCNSPTKVDFV